MYIHFDPILPLRGPPSGTPFLHFRPCAPYSHVSPLSFNDPLSNWGCRHVYRNEVILLNQGQVTSGYILKKNDYTL